MNELPVAENCPKCKGLGYVFEYDDEDLCTPNLLPADAFKRDCRKCRPSMTSMLPAGKVYAKDKVWTVCVCGGRGRFFDPDEAEWPGLDGWIECEHCMGKGWTLKRLSLWERFVRGRLFFRPDPENPANWGSPEDVVK